MEHVNLSSNLGERPESSDDKSSDGHGKKKSASKSSRKFEVSHSQARREEAGKGLFSLLDGSRPKVFEVPKKVEKLPSFSENTFVDTPVNSEKTIDSAETVAHPEVILPEEKLVIAQNILQAETAVLQQELYEVAPESDEATEAANVISFIDEVSARIESGQPSTEELFDEVLSDILEDLGLDNSEILRDDREASGDSAQAENAIDEETESLQEDEDGGVARASAGTGSGTTSPVGGTGTGHTPGGGAATTGSGGPGAGGAGAGAGGTSPPGGGAGTPPPGGGAAGGGGFGAGPPAPTGPVGSFGPMGGALRPPAPAIMETSERRNGRRELLIGGLVGYLIGRRRGRIKTEKKLLPIQKSLEQQVKNLNYQITDRELTIRQLTRDNLQKERVAKLTQQKQEQLKPHNAENAFIAPPVEKVERIDTTHTTEHKVDAALMVQHAEKLGAVIVPLPESVNERHRVGEETLSNRRDEHELSEMAAKIKVGDTNVKQLLEQGRISPQDAEKMVELYRKGDSQHEKILQKEVSIVDKTEDFETLRRKKPEIESSTTGTRQSPVSQDSELSEYSPVNAINSQLSQVNGRSTTEGKKHTSRVMIWTTLAVVAVVLVGFMLVLAV